MNFTVIREHREFFRKHHWIECDGVISAEERRRLLEGIEHVTAVRAAEKLAVSKAFDKNSFAVGHDLWRGQPVLKKIILNRGLAGIAGELVEQRPLRFGYDSLFPAVSSQPIKNSYESFLQTTPTLQEMSCIQGVLCGAMLCISGNDEAKVLETDEIDPNPQATIFSKIPGNAIFFAPDWPLPLHEIYNHAGFTYLLIVYVKANAVYVAQQGDPHLHNFKQLDYSFGDRLKEPHHPIVYS
jgi:hypothetical protein